MLDDLIRRTLLDHIKSSAGPSVKTAPASAFGRTENGLVMITSPATLVGRTAGDLRIAGFVVPNNIPDHAIIQHVAGEGPAYCWQEASPE